MEKNLNTFEKDSPIRFAYKERMKNTKDALAEVLRT